MMMKMLSSVLLFLVFAAPTPAADVFVPIDTHPHHKADYYPFITHLSRGPSQRLDTSDSEQVRLLSHRVAVLGDELETLVFLEEIISGEGDCCRSVLSIRRLDLEEIHTRFALPGKTSDFTLLRWLSPTSFEFEIQHRRFILDGLGKEHVRVKEKADVGGRMSDVRKEKQLSTMDWSGGQVLTASGVRSAGYGL